MGHSIRAGRGAPCILTLKLEDEYKLFEKPTPEGLEAHWIKEYPQAWAETGGMGLAIQQPPLVISWKASATPVSIKQYPMSQEAYQRIKPQIKRFLDQGILTPCWSP